VPTTKSTLFVVSKDEWDTKEGIGKSMKSTLYEQRCLKRHLLTLSSEKIKPVSFAILVTHWSEGIRQLVSQSV